MWVRSLGWEDLLKELMATHSSILAWRIHAGLRGCEPEDFESKRKETSDAHQSLTTGTPSPRMGVAKFCPLI